MSGSEGRDESRLVRELAETPGAVPVLVALLESGGSASRDGLLAAGDRDTDDAIRWLTAVNLVRRSGAAGTFDLDQHGIEYELTAIGTSLTRSFIDLANAVSDPSPAPRRKVTIAED